MKFKDVGSWATVIAVILFAAHMITIDEDVQAVIEDPNENNKPGEILKLFVDLSRYWPK